MEKSFRQQAVLAAIFLAIGLVVLSIIVSLIIYFRRHRRERRASIADCHNRPKSPPSFIDYATKCADSDEATAGKMMRSSLTAEHDYLHYGFDWDHHRVVSPLLDVPMPTTTTTTLDQHDCYYYGNEDIDTTDSRQSNSGNSGLFGADHHHDLHQAVRVVVNPGPTTSTTFLHWRYSETPSSPSVYPDTLPES